MRCAILRDFLFSVDGIRSIEAIAGGEAEIPEALVPGLVAEGFVGLVDVQTTGAAQAEGGTAAATQAEGGATGAAQAEGGATGAAQAGDKAGRPVSGRARGGVIPAAVQPAVGEAQG